MYSRLWPITVFISIVGIIGNLISILVWKILRNQKKKKGIGGCITYFILLPAIDTCTLLMYLVAESIIAAVPYVRSSKAFLTFYCYIGHPLYFFFVYVSGFLVVSLTIQRAQLIMSPLRNHKVNVKQQTRGFILFAFLVSFLLNITSFFAFVPEMVAKVSTNTTVVVNATRYKTIPVSWNLSKNAMKHKDVMFIIRCVIATGLPAILILLGNITICRNQKKNNHSSRSLTKHQCISTPRQPLQVEKVEERNKTMYVTLLLITSTAFTVWFVRCISGCMQYMVHTENVAVNPHIILQNFAITIGASVNLLIYYLPGRAFRTQLKALFLGKAYRSRKISRFSSIIQRKQSNYQEQLVESGLLQMS